MLGVRHYWLADPEARRVACDPAEGGRYVQVAVREGEATLAPPDWPGLTRRLAELWR
ncbi:MAG: hypothetical protein QN119_13210 [Armatimonadota bacterium]|nr:hypothetical protein [Armatimonadota bacterium]